MLLLLFLGLETVSSSGYFWRQEVAESSDEDLAMKVLQYVDTLVVKAV